MRNLVLIGAPARVGGEVMGSLAVIGPPRIDYQHTITAVSYIARLFDKILNEIGVSKLYGKKKRENTIGSSELDVEHELPPRTAMRERSGAARRTQPAEAITKCRS